MLDTVPRKKGTVVVGSWKVNHPKELLPLLTNVVTREKRLSPALTNQEIEREKAMREKSDKEEIVIY